MSSVGSSIHTGTDKKKSYLTTTDFRHDFYKYSTSFSNRTFTTSGTLLLVDPNGLNTPSRRVLHENGKKLRPEINPMNIFGTGAAINTPTFLVGVYDPVSLLHGFIDPTSSVFALYDTNYSVGEMDERKNGLITNTDGQGSKLNVGAMSELTANTSPTVDVGNANIGSILLTGSSPGPYIVDIRTSAFENYTNAKHLIFVTSQTPNVIVSADPSAAPGGYSFRITAYSSTALSPPLVNWIIVN